MRGKTGAFRLAIVLLALSFSPAQGGSPGDGRRGGSAAPDCAPSLDLIASALSQGRPQRLEPLLPPGERLHVSLSTIGPARGLYGGAQFLVLLERFFERCRPEGFHSQRFDGEQGAAAATLHGTLRCRTDQGSVSIRLHLTVEYSGGRWRLSEVWETD